MLKRTGIVVMFALVAGGAVGSAHAGPTLVAPAPTLRPVNPVGTVVSKPLPPQHAMLVTDLSPPHTRSSLAPVLAADGDNVFALLGSLPDWQQPNYPIFVARSTDGGGTFGAPVLVTAPAHFSTRRGRIIARGGLVVMTWVTDATLYYAMSTNHGQSFSGP
jgi:hypothetical protein